MDDLDFNHLEGSQINLTRGSHVLDGLLCLMCNKKFKTPKSLETHQKNNKCLDTIIKYPAISAKKPL